MRAIDLDGVPEAEPVAPVEQAWCTMCGMPAIPELDLCVECARARLQQPIPLAPFLPWNQPAVSPPNELLHYSPVSAPFVLFDDNTYTYTDSSDTVTVTTTDNMTTGNVFVVTGGPGYNKGHGLTITSIDDGTLTYTPTSGAGLQSALQQAGPGDVISLPYNTSYVTPSDCAEFLKPDDAPSVFDGAWMKAVVKALSDSIDKQLFKGFTT